MVLPRGPGAAAAGHSPGSTEHSVIGRLGKAGIGSAVGDGPTQRQGKLSRGKRHPTRNKRGRRNHADSLRTRITAGAEWLEIDAYQRARRNSVYF